MKLGIKNCVCWRLNMLTSGQCCISLKGYIMICHILHVIYFISCIIICHILYVKLFNYQKHNFYIGLRNPTARNYDIMNIITLYNMYFITSWILCRWASLDSGLLSLLVLTQRFSLWHDICLYYSSEWKAENDLNRD